MTESVVSKAYIVTGQPHVLLAPERNQGWQSLRNSYDRVRKDIEKQEADIALFFSTQWLSVIGWLFQADPKPTWRHVDPNWHDLGTIPYQFRVDPEFAAIYADEVKRLTSKHVATVNYHGFPIDTGTIVAQKLLNPDNRLPAAMVSCNMYAEKAQTILVGRAAASALARAQKKAIVVLVTSLSNRYHIHDIDPKEDSISSLKDDEWNRKVLQLLSEGRLEDVDQCAREYSNEANADMRFKGIWWLSGLLGQCNDFTGEVFDYQPVWGTGQALVGLTPTKPVVPRAAGEEAAQVTSVDSKTAPEPVGPYPHARREGDMLYLSGIGPRKRGSKEIPGLTLDAKGNEASHDIEAQAESVIENIKTILEEAGSSLDEVIDVQVFLTDMKNDFQKFNKVYEKHFGTIRPTRTTVGVIALPTPIAVELKVVAKKKTKAPQKAAHEISDDD